MQFYSISAASSQTGPRKAPERRFGAFQPLARKLVPGRFQKAVGNANLKMSLGASAALNPKRA